jgi:hypothetical protein
MRASASGIVQLQSHDLILSSMRWERKVMSVTSETLKRVSALFLDSGVPAPVLLLRRI